MEEGPQTIVVYHLDDEETPYRSKLRKPPDHITLQDFKSLITNPPRTYKYFFKSEDADFGTKKFLACKTYLVISLHGAEQLVQKTFRTIWLIIFETKKPGRVKALPYFANRPVVKEEINDDKSRLPVLNGRIEAWLVSVDSSSAHSDTTPSSLGIQASRGTKKSGAYKLDVHNVLHSPAQVTQQRRLREQFDDESACTSDNESTFRDSIKCSKEGHTGNHMLELRIAVSTFEAVLLPIRETRQRQKMEPLSIPNWKIRVYLILMTKLERSSVQKHNFSSIFHHYILVIFTRRASFSTDITSVSRQFLKKKRNKRRCMGRPLASKASVISSITESSASLNIITVVLNIERNGGYLGISIVGHSDYPNGDGGIYVAGIMKGGAVALDGRIEPNDMILQVNEQSFHNLSNDEAVHYLQRVAKEPGPIKLVVAKSFNSRRRFALDDLDFRQSEPVQPIDPGAWVAHTNALALNNVAANNAPLSQLQQPPPPNYRHHLTSDCAAVVARSSGTGMIDVGGSMMMAQSPMDYLQHRPASAATAASNNSETWTTIGDEKEPKLDLSIHRMHTIVKYMSRADSGLEIKTRNWLKIEIPDAFLGSHLVDWLLNRVHGFSDRKEARKYAADMLKENYIRHTVKKCTFTEQCYYAFNNLLSDNFAAMHVAEDCPNPELDFLPPPPPSLNQTPTVAIAATTGSWATPRQTPPPLPPAPSQQQLDLAPGVATPAYSSLFPAPSSTNAGADLPVPSPVSRPSPKTTMSQPPSSISDGSAVSSSHSAAKKSVTPGAVPETS
uniref:Dishevelled n=1 Tax=Romanomermis culicivorax TaxID=13658 RepID=A0A915HNB1_ROMCU